MTGDQFSELVASIRRDEEPLVGLYEELERAAGTGTRLKLAQQMLEYQRFQMECLDLLEGEVPEDFQCFGQIIDRDVNLREGAGPRHRLVTKLGRGTPIIIMSYHGNWTRIQTPEGQTGYVFKDYAECRLS